MVFMRFRLFVLQPDAGIQSYKMFILLTPTMSQKRTYDCKKIKQKCLKNFLWYQEFNISNSHINLTPCVKYQRSHRDDS